MQTAIETILLPIIITTIVFLVLSGAVIYALFIYQRKKFRYQQELTEMREASIQARLDIQEQTLDHIAKELHASVSPLVSLININLSEIFPQSSPDQRENILETKSLAKQLMGELKALSASLNTDHIIHIGFVKALENALNQLSKKYKIVITRTGEEYRLLPEHEHILFRLCQEVLNNVVNYAKASQIAASLSFSPDHFILTIADDGIGFNVEEALKRSGEKQSTGLLNMKKRAAVIRSAFTITSQTGGGTVVSISIPHPEKSKSLVI